VPKMPKVIEKMIMFKKPVAIFFICFFCLFFLCMGKAAIGAYNDVRGFNTAAGLLDNGMYLEALSIYQEISDYSDKQDNRARALLFMGTTCSLYLDQHDAALEQFDKIIKTYPISPAASDALFNSGMVLYEKGEFKKAYEFFKKYMKKYPDGLRGQSAEVWADSAKTQMSQIREPEEIALIPLDKRDAEDTIIRVLVENSSEKITIYSEQNISLYNPFSKKMIYRSSEPVTFTKQGEQLAANGRKLDLTMCAVKTDGKTIMVDNRRFRGDLTILADSKSLSVINNIPVEQYLYGVVPKEMPHDWEKEALKAQAVAARTYALYIKDKSADKPYDVESTTTSQVYGGFDSEKEESNLAVDETQGQVLTYNGRLIVAYFHSSSGGHTEDSKNVWSTDLPYLKGIPDTFSANIPNGQWSFFVSYNDMQNSLNKYGLNIGQIRGLNAAGESRSGRLLGVRVIAKNGTTELKSNNFRIKVGATGLKSTLLKIAPDRDGILFTGKGYGHGVGMSQWGANVMAQKGFDYQDILKHYYQSVKIVALSSQQ